MYNSYMMFVINGTTETFKGERQPLNTRSCQKKSGCGSWTLHLGNPFGKKGRATDTGYCSDYKGLTVMTDTTRRSNNRGDLSPQIGLQAPSFYGSSPKESTIGSSWWSAIKGIGKRRRKSTASSIPDNALDVTWQPSQVARLIDEKNVDGEFISCVAYDDTGQLVAGGCKNGRVIILSQDQENQKNLENGSESGASKGPIYFFYSSFQSHEPEFDYMKSAEIDEKIYKLRWLKRPNTSNFLLSANERTVKLWKLSERCTQYEDDLTNDYKNGSFISSLRIPKYKRIERNIVPSQRRIYFGAHEYRINSLSTNSDLETFLTADDLRINVWHLEVPDLSFNIVDTKPECMEDLTEVITAAEFHPQKCSLFVYGNSKGSVRLCDMRSKALCDQYAKVYAEPQDDGSHTFFSDIIRCVSDLKFSSDGRYIMARDYLGLKIWDLAMESQPVETYPICDFLRSRLCSLYENEHIFDKFECSWGCGNRFVMSGLYSNYFKIFDRTSGRSVILESNAVKKGNEKDQKRNNNKSKNNRDEINPDNLDFRKKLLHAAWHPNENLITNAVGNSLHFFHGKDSLSDYL